MFFLFGANIDKQILILEVLITFCASVSCVFLYFGGLFSVCNSFMNNGWWGIMTWFIVFSVY